MARSKDLGMVEFELFIAKEFSRGRFVIDKIKNLSKLILSGEYLLIEIGEEVLSLSNRLIIKLFVMVNSNTDNTMAC